MQPATGKKILRPYTKAKLLLRKLPGTLHLRRRYSIPECFTKYLLKDGNGIRKTSRHLGLALPSGVAIQPFSVGSAPCKE